MSLCVLKLLQEDPQPSDIYRRASTVLAALQLQGVGAERL